MVDRTVRSLAHLDETASTSRVLNLLSVHRRHHRDPAHRRQPFFRHPALNKAIVLKHRLRRPERELLLTGRRTATKIILPIDGEELKLGGRFAFVGQVNFEAMMAETLGDGWVADRSDRDLLMVIDALPSLDPFLLREQVRRHGHDPARCYFDISERETARMSRFVEREIQTLIDLCYAGRGQDGRLGARLASKILSSTVDAETEPLRLTLRLAPHDYQEGVFCWKGFLYYKWTLEEQLADVSRVAEAIARTRPRGHIAPETAVQLEASREALHGAILEALREARASLRYYDDAFNRLVAGDPGGFRAFLLSAPALFCELGERLGAVSHIVSYWGFRFPAGRLPVVGAEELLDIVADFQDSLALTGPPPALATLRLAC